MSEERLFDPVEARKKAMDYLARREHGRAELVAKLEKVGFDTAVSEDAVAGLVADGLQSDTRFVEAFVQSRIHRGKGPVRIRSELRERGLSVSVIDAGLTEAEQDWQELAREVRRKKFGERPVEFSDKARQMRFLEHRGFEPQHIRAAVSTDED